MEKKATFFLHVERQKGRKVIRKTSPDTERVIKSFS